MKKSINIYIYIEIINLMLSFNVYGQDYTPYQWEENRPLTSLNEIEQKYDLYYIQKAEQYQFAYDSKSNNLVCYATYHAIIRVNNDDALGKSNRVYIPMTNTLELLEIKARAITKEGRVINFDQKNIKALEEDKSGYKILAIEGAEVGGEIEFYYTRKITPPSFYTRYFQYDFPVKSYSFNLTCPENLEYDFKVYNHKAKVEKVAIDSTQHINMYTFKANNIPALYEEGFSAYENSKKRIELKLAYNSSSGNSRINTWGVAGKRIYDQIYNLNSNEEKELNKFIKKVDYVGDPIDAFKKYEHYIKSNYFFEENAGESGEQLDLIFKNKYASSRGFTKLYAAILTRLGVKHEIVLVSNRYKSKFDPSFDSWNYLDEYLIYINQVNLFLSPKETPFRLGTIPDEYLSSPALFIQPKLIQDYTYPVAHISNIPAPSYKDNTDNMEINVSFSDGFEENSINVIRSYSGYSAQYYKAAFLVLEEDRKKELLNDIIKYLALDAEIKEIEVIEKNLEYNNWNKPFTVKGAFTTNSYIESAGEAILFKVGNLIGQQSELYQEEERVTPIVNTINRGYLRKIKVTIPDGYSVKNPEDLILKEQVFKDEKLIFNFVSSYTINGQNLEIAIEEYYDEIYYPIEKFEAFRKVINAAADWNKIILVLEQ